MPTTSPRILFARQPIVDRDGAIVAHELLYRSPYEREGAFFIDNALATADVVDAAFRPIGIEASVGRARALVNVDADFLLSRRVEQLPQESVMLELLETIEIDAQIVRRCRTLKERGYQLALDDVCHYREVRTAARIHRCGEDRCSATRCRIACEVSAATQGMACAAACREGRYGVRLKQCVELGLDWFHGFFCGRPVVLSA